MVPARPCGRERRTPAAAVGAREAPAKDADHAACDHCGDTQQRQRIDDVRPVAVHQAAAQRVQPVQPRARVVPLALGACGIAHHLAGRAGDVEHRVVCIAQAHAVQRSVHVQRAGVGEGVFLQRAFVNGMGRTLRVGCSAGQCPWRVDGHEHGAGAGVDHHRGAARACVAGRGGLGRLGRGQIHRPPTAGHGQPQVAQRALQPGGGQGLVGLQRHGGAAQRRQVHQPLGGRELGIAHVHHHHAGDEPHGEEGAQQHAQPAVDQKQPAFGMHHHGLRLLRRRRAASRRPCAARPGRPGPGVLRRRRSGRWHCAGARSARLSC